MDLKVGYGHAMSVTSPLLERTSCLVQGAGLGGGKTAHGALCFLLSFAVNLKWPKEKICCK